MIYRNLGNTKTKISLIGYGAWKIGKKGWTDVSDYDSEKAINFAYEQGINFFDTAPVYGLGYSEKLLGKVLNRYRDKVVIASKIGLSWNSRGKVYKDLSKTRIADEIDEILSRLRTDYIDLLQLHWDDKVTPIEEIMESLLIEQKKGKFKYIGLCNFGLDNIKIANTMTTIQSIQGYYNILERNPEKYHTQSLDYRSENELIPYCRDKNISFIPFSPLAQGFLTNDFDFTKISKKDVRRFNPIFVNNSEERNILIEKSKKENMSLSEYSILWLAKKPAISSILISSTNTDHILSNVNILKDIDRDISF